MITGRHQNVRVCRCHSQGPSSFTHEHHLPYGNGYSVSNSDNSICQAVEHFWNMSGTFHRGRPRAIYQLGFCHAPGTTQCHVHVAPQPKRELPWMATAAILRALQRWMKVLPSTKSVIGPMRIAKFWWTLIFQNPELGSVYGDGNLAATTSSRIPRKIGRGSFFAFSWRVPFLYIPRA